MKSLGIFNAVFIGSLSGSAPPPSEEITWPTGDAELSTHNQTYDVNETTSLFDQATGVTNHHRSLSLSKWHAVPCTMTLKRLKVRLSCHATPLSALYVEVWRTSTTANNTFSRVGTSGNLVAQVTPLDGTARVIELVLDSPIACVCDDLPCVYAVSSGGSINYRKGDLVSSTAGAYVEGVLGGFSDVVFTQLAGGNAYPVHCYGTVPQLVAYGDSQADGRASSAFSQADGPWDQIGGLRHTYAGHMEVASGHTCLHRGYLGQTSTSCWARWASAGGAIGISHLDCPVIFAMGGLGMGNNIFAFTDITDPVEIAAKRAVFLGNCTALLDATVALDKIVVFEGCRPGTGYSANENIVRHAWNADLAALCGTYPPNRVVYVDPGPYCSSGPPYNSMVPGYVADTFHYNTAGATAICNALWAAFEAWAVANNITYT